MSPHGVIGEYDGIDMVIAKQIAESNGMTAAMENMEFDSLLVALQNGQIDAVIAGMTATDERRETVISSIILPWRQIWLTRKSVCYRAIPEKPVCRIWATPTRLSRRAQRRSWSW